MSKKRQSFSIPLSLATIAVLMLLLFISLFAVKSSYLKTSLAPLPTFTPPAVTIEIPMSWEECADQVAREQGECLEDCDSIEDDDSFNDCLAGCAQTAQSGYDQCETAFSVPTMDPVLQPQPSEPPTGGNYDNPNPYGTVEPDPISE